jgi:hypothetical protein
MSPYRESAPRNLCCEEQAREVERLTRLLHEVCLVVDLESPHWFSSYGSPFSAQLRMWWHKRQKSFTKPITWVYPRPSQPWVISVLRVALNFLRRLR